MAQFYGSIQSNGGETTRGGSKNSGLHAHIRGWSIGVKVSCYTNDSSAKRTIVVIKEE